MAILSRYANSSVIRCPVLACNLIKYCVFLCFFSVSDASRAAALPVDDSDYLISSGRLESGNDGKIRSACKYELANLSFTLTNCVTKKLWFSILSGLTVPDCLHHQRTH